MSDRRRANLESKFRGFAEEAVRADEQRLLQLIRQVINEAGIIRPGAIPILPPNTHNTINDESVVVSFEDYSSAIDLETLLGEMLAAVAAPPIAIQEADGDPLGSVATIIVPNGSLSIDDDTDTGTLDFSTLFQPLAPYLTQIAALVDPNADRILFWDDSAGAFVFLTLGTNLSITGTTINASGGGGSIDIKEGGSTVVATAAAANFDASDFNITDEGSSVAGVALNYGTGAGQPAEGNHTHAGSAITVQEGDVDVDTAVTTIDFDASDFNVTSSPAGEANVTLNYGTGAGTPAEGNHDHSGIYQPLDSDLTALAGNSTDGLWAHTGAGTGEARTITGTTGQIDVSNGSGAGGNPTLSTPNQARDATVNFVIDGRGSAIVTGIKGVFQIDFDGTIISNTLLADQSGSVTITIKKSTYSGFAGSLTSIVASAKPTLSSAQKSTDATLTGWTTSFSAGDVFEVTVDTVATITRLTLALKVRRS